MRISKWLFIVALALPISTFAHLDGIAPTEIGFIEVGTVVSAKSKMIKFPCTGRGADKCTITVTNIVTTKGKYTVRGRAAVSVGEKMTRNPGYLLCGEGHTVSSLKFKPTCYEVMIGITYRE
ncbi:hypothetical protein LCGC14_0985850 [marine sediment metagenome]|uniref:Uncharacterized protein n=1 Tax=marine sediment metagenome TaxID=412755 RepID=A0A0F9N7A9_9ZZZZ